VQSFSKPDQRNVDSAQQQLKSWIYIQVFASNFAKCSPISLMFSPANLNDKFVMKQLNFEKLITT